MNTAAEEDARLMRVITERNTLADRVAALEAALQNFADVRNWAVNRDEFREPQHVWIGTVREHPAKIASDALAARAATGDAE